VTCTAPDPSAHDRHAQHWHAGFHQPWHAPRGVPGSYSSFEHAQQALASDMDLHARSEAAWAGEHPCQGETCETYDESGRRRAEEIRAARGDLLRSKGPSWSGSAAGLAYWVTPCPGCATSSASSPELEAAASA
jgi:hypothetical protein